MRPFWRVYWNQDPGAEIARIGRVYCLGPGAVLLIPPATSVEQRLMRGPVRSLFVHVQAGQPWDAWTGRVWALPAARFGRRWLANLARQVEAEGATPSPLTALQLQLFALRALVCSAEDGPPPDPLDPLAAELRAAVEAEPDRDWTVAALAGKVEQSARTLQRRMHESGTAPRTLLWLARRSQGNTESTSHPVEPGPQGAEPDGALINHKILSRSATSRSLRVELHYVY